MAAGDVNHRPRRARHGCQTIVARSPASRSWPDCGRYWNAFSLIYDYTVGFALSDRSTVNEQRIQDQATRLRLHNVLKSLPADQFPALFAIGEHVCEVTLGQVVRFGRVT